MRPNLSIRLARNQIKNNKVIYRPYMVVGALMTALIYIVFSVADMLSDGRFQGAAAMQSVVQVMAVIFCIMAFFVLFYLNSFIMKRRKRAFGLYAVLGLDKRHLIGIMLAELLMTGIVMLAAGFASGALVSGLVFRVLLKLCGLPVQFVFKVSAPAAAVTLALFAVLFVTVFFYNAAVIARLHIVGMLTGEQAGEKMPRTNWLISLAAVLLLGAGYGLALQSQTPIGAFRIFFPAVVAVILGTYALFTAGSVLILKALKRHSAFYYKRTHFINVSNLIFRLKQNAVGLATICILFTCALVTLSSTLSLYLGVRNYGDKTFRAAYKVMAVRETVASVSGVPLSRLEPDSLMDTVGPLNRALAASAGVRVGNEQTSLEGIFKDGARPVSADDLSEAGAGYRVMRAYHFDVIDGDGAAYAAQFRRELEHLEQTASDAGYYVLQVRSEIQSEWLGLYGSILFVGIYFVLFFLVGTVIIIYYKQVTEGYADQRRFEILQQIGLDRVEGRRLISRQVLTMFFLPLIVAAVHVAGSYPMMSLLVSGLSNMVVDRSLFLTQTAASLGVFTLIYLAVYCYTARVYGRIVRVS